MTGNIDWFFVLTYLMGIVSAKLFDFGFESFWEWLGRLYDMLFPSVSKKSWDQIERERWLEVERIERWALKGGEVGKLSGVNNLLDMMAEIEGRIIIESKTVSVLKKWDLEAYQQKINHARMIIGHVEREHPQVLAGLFGKNSFESIDSACDRHYRNGFMAGWNAGGAGDEHQLKEVQNRMPQKNGGQ